VPLDDFTPTDSLQMTILGSGTSMGVPTLGCPCLVCHSEDPRDNRTRPSVLVSRSGHNVVIDTTPDFRQQALRQNLKTLDAIVYTHFHADHILGFDDIRPFNMRQNSAMPVYAAQDTLAVLRRVFSYAFREPPPGITVPRVIPLEVTGPFTLLGTTWTPVAAEHGEITVLGYRIGKFGYLTDFSRIPESSMPLLEQLDDLVLDALRDIPHPMHQTVEQALQVVSKLRPKRAWFTHIAHDLPHAETNDRLARMGFANVRLAYDGLSFEVAV
jgi:phosphoribosyl 1,2-cyclic phosphate phosphodiesterase